MARLPRLVVPGFAHYVIQRGHGARPVFRDDADRDAYLEALRDGDSGCRLALHAWALADHEVQLLVTPPDPLALSRLMQTVGRRYVSAYNRRYGCSGTLWDGRFRCGVVEPGAPLLAALRMVDAQPGRTSATHRTGGARDPSIADPAEYWQLGNTPFEREAAYRTLLVQPLAPALANQLRLAALGGWAVGTESFVRSIGETAGRPTRPRARGRPARH